MRTAREGLIAGLPCQTWLNPLFFMLTKNKIIQFSRMLEDMLILTKDMTKTRAYENLFTSEKDLNDSRLASLIVPDDYYSCKFFDTLIEIRYHSRFKNYYIHIESKDYSIFNYEFKITFENCFNDLYSTNSGDSGLCLFCKKEFGFSLIVNIYKRVVKYFIEKSFIQDSKNEVF